MIIMDGVYIVNFLFLNREIKYRKRGKVGWKRGRDSQRVKGRKARKKEKRKEYVAKKYSMIPFICNFAYTCAYMCTRVCKEISETMVTKNAHQCLPGRLFFSLILLLCCLVIPDEDVLYQYFEVRRWHNFKCRKK